MNLFSKLALSALVVASLRDVVLLHRQHFTLHPVLHLQLRLLLVGALLVRKSNFLVFLFQFVLALAACFHVLQPLTLLIVLFLSLLSEIQPDQLVQRLLFLLALLAWRLLSRIEIASLSFRLSSLLQAWRALCLAVLAQQVCLVDLVGRGILATKVAGHGLVEMGCSSHQIDRLSEVGLREVLPNSSSSQGLLRLLGVLCLLLDLGGGLARGLQGSLAGFGLGRLRESDPTLGSLELGRLLNLESALLE